MQEGGIYDGRSTAGEQSGVECGGMKCNQEGRGQLRGENIMRWLLMKCSEKTVYMK